MSYEKLAEHLVDWLRDEVEAAAARGLVLGLSGGIDSAVVAVLARRAFRDGHLALLMPIHSDQREHDDAMLVVETFALRHRVLELTPAFEAMLSAIGVEEYDPSASDLPAGNLKPRLRMAALYHFANELRYLVVGTGNRSELTLGYFTKHGDGGVDLLPLGHLVKRRVRSLAEELGVPRSILDKPPSAGMWKGQTDEGELGFSYEELDAYLREGEGSPELAARVNELRRRNAHKLRTPKMPPSFSES